jgi:hypothetical protein
MKFSRYILRSSRVQQVICGLQASLMYSIIVLASVIMGVLGYYKAGWRGQEVPR